MSAYRVDILYNVLCTTKRSKGELCSTFCNRLISSSLTMCVKHVYIYVYITFYNNKCDILFRFILIAFTLICFNNFYLDEIIYASNNLFSTKKINILRGGLIN